LHRSPFFGKLHDISLAVIPASARRISVSSAAPRLDSGSISEVDKPYVCSAQLHHSSIFRYGRGRRWAPAVTEIVA
jgi:hypothetical protein